MSIKINVHGIEVVCDIPEQATAVAMACAALEVPDAGVVASRSSGPVRLEMNGIVMECDTPETAAATMIAAIALSGRRRKNAMASRSQGQGVGPQRAWEEAGEYAEKHNISKDEARRLLAKKKRR